MPVGLNYQAVFLNFEGQTPNLREREKPMPRPTPPEAQQERKQSVSKGGHRPAPPP